MERKQVIVYILVVVLVLILSFIVVKSFQKKIVGYGTKESCPCHGCTESTKGALTSQSNIGIDETPSGNNLFSIGTIDNEAGC